MQARSVAAGERNVVDAALAMHPHRPELARILGLSIFGDAEAEGIVERDGRFHVIRIAIEMVDAQRLDAPIELVLLMDRPQLVHAEVEFDRDPERIDGTQRATLVRALDPAALKILCVEIVPCLVKIALAENLEAQ